MRIKALSIIAFLALLTAGVRADIDNVDRYWISFCSRSFFAPSEYFLMEIDASGRILQTPQRVFTAIPGDDSRSAVALSSNAKGNILFWWCGKGHTLSRIILDKRSLRQLSMEKTDMDTSLIRSFGATQKNADNFLALKKGDARLWAYEVGPDGFHQARKRWPISTQRIGDNLQPNPIASQQVGVSSDGRVSWWIDTQKRSLYVQPLTMNGRRTGEPGAEGLELAYIRRPSTDHANVCFDMMKFQKTRAVSTGLAPASSSEVPWVVRRSSPLPAY